MMHHQHIRPVLADPGTKGFFVPITQGLGDRKALAHRLAELGYQIGGVVGAPLVLVLLRFNGHADPPVTGFFQQVERLDHLVVVGGFHMMEIPRMPERAADLHRREMIPVKRQAGLVGRHPGDHDQAADATVAARSARSLKSSAVWNSPASVGSGNFKPAAGAR